MWRLGSFRVQLIVGISVVHALLMVIFIYDLAQRQIEFMGKESLLQAKDLSLVLSTVASPWLLEHDYSGLQELVLNQRKYAHLRFAMVFSPDGKILAHTDSNKVGQYLGQVPETKTSEGADSISAVADISIDSGLIGKVWITVGKEVQNESVQEILRNGAIYTLLAIFIGVLTALFVVRILTQRLNQIIAVTQAVKDGIALVKLPPEGPDEIGQLSAGLNSMLASLEAKGQALEKAMGNANLANQAKSDFLANMSHEIRTPINSLIGISDILIDTPLNEEQKKLVHIFHKSGDNLIRIVNDLLDFSKIEAGELTIIKNGFSVNELFNDLVNLNQDNAKAKNLQLKVAIDPHLPDFLNGDRHRLQQVLMNLISNALKFSHEGFIEIAAAKKSEDAKGFIVEFSVTDQGLGIAKDQQEKLFQRFIQLDSSSTRTTTGTGLGLAISKRLVSLMGGQIGYRGDLGKGSCFYFNLPMNLGAPETQVNLSGPAQGSTPKKILLADDSEDNRMVIRLYLKDQPIELIECGDGQAALNLFMSSQFDLVLLDLQMPIMDGYHAIQKMRDWEMQNHRARTRVLALSADSLPELVEKALSAGCDAHISKPVRKKQLLQAILEPLAPPVSS